MINTKHSDYDIMRETFDDMGIEYKTGEIEYCDGKVGYEVIFNNPESCNRAETYLFDQNGKYEFAVI